MLPSAWLPPLQSPAPHPHHKQVLTFAQEHCRPTLRLGRLAMGLAAPRAGGRRAERNNEPGPGASALGASSAGRASERGTTCRVVLHPKASPCSGAAAFGSPSPAATLLMTAPRVPDPSPHNLHSAPCAERRRAAQRRYYERTRQKRAAERALLASLPPGATVASAAAAAELPDAVLRPTGRAGQRARKRKGGEGGADALQPAEEESEW